MRLLVVFSRLGVGLLMVAVGVLAFGANALAAPMPPLTELEQAQSHVSALVGAGDMSAKVALRDAMADLEEATAEGLPAPAYGGLWVDPSDAVPPPYGDAIFAKTTAAVKKLYRILDDRTVSEEALLTASNEIVEAEYDLAAGAATEVQGFRTPPGTPAQKWRAAFSALGKQITDAVTSVPQATLEHAANAYIIRENLPPGLLEERVRPITGFPPLTDEGKPEVFFFGSEGCPFCAIERWSLVAALARFGKFSPLAPTVSSTLDIFPATHTLNFYRDRYKSSYVAFVADEADTSLWTPLQEPTSSQIELLEELEVRGFPFVDFANKWESPPAGGTTHPGPEAITGMSWQEIAATMGEPSSTTGQEIDFAAEVATAEICDVDGERPLAACGSELIHGIKEAL